MNPFKYGQVVRNDDFCKRDRLSESLLDYIKRGQNVYIQGERRTGKTSLVFETTESANNHIICYIDLLEVKSLTDLVKRMVVSLLSLEKKSGFVEKTFKQLSHLRPVVSVDPVTGLPSMSIDSSLRFTPDSITGVLDLIASQRPGSRQVVIVFDEFQDILNIENTKEALAILRSKIQFHTDTPYVFAGSVRKKMEHIFTDPDSAFFKSTAPIYVGPLDRGVFKKFLVKKFESGNRSVDPGFLDVILKICFDVPGDVQQLCSSLWETTSEGETIVKDHLHDALKRVFAHESKGYETCLKIISKQQLTLLTALARMGGRNPTASQFLLNSGIPQASSIRTALKRLIALKIIFHYENEYRFVNPFFRAWLLYKKL